MKLALVHDDLIQHGGAERLFGAMREVWPKADIFTSMASKSWRQLVGRHAELTTSFMQRLPLKKVFYRAYFPLYPLAFESFDLADYDVVLSSSTRFAHGVVTRPKTVHICYMNSPGRMFWEPQAYFSGAPLLREALSPLLGRLRVWDYAAAQRVDYFIANSGSVKQKIKKYYGRDSEVIYPFVELERFGKGATPDAVDPAQPGYFLVVSRLAAWKRIDIVIGACNQLKLPLVIVGEGPDRARLERMAGPTVEFRGRLSDEGVVECYQGAGALIFPQREDFGITPLEAMASGRPVVAYRAGGALETILPGETGEFFYPQTVEALAGALSVFHSGRYSPERCRMRAEEFSRRRFAERLTHLVGSQCLT